MQIFWGCADTLFLLFCICICFLFAMCYIALRFCHALLCIVAVSNVPAIWEARHFNLVYVYRLPRILLPLSLASLSKNLDFFVCLHGRIFKTLPLRQTSLEMPDVLVSTIVMGLP
jgi:hypothetical protein